MSDNLVTLYPTSLLHRHIAGMEETNRQLAAFIKSIEETEPNAVDGSTNDGGFQTSTEFLKREHAALNILKQHIRTAVQAYARTLVEQECSARPVRLDFVLWGWGAILRQGNTQGIHVHPYANISGVYYVAAPPAALESGAEGGKICFYDPRPRANMNQLPRQITRRRQSPQPGDLIVFPSWLEHSVSAFQGPGERICVAFNARLTAT
ncbi:MAG TPA: 2OG-Fe(II) oxygenase family protein [Steroidobacteraceae bacterium]|jgi:uncharacterized protein (TIGR02466 family)